MAARDRTRAGQLSYGELEQLWQQAGGSPSLAPTMAAIALAESSGRTNALNDDPSTGDYSVGPWQINFYGNLMGPRTKRYGSPAQLIADPLRDARAAVDLAGPDGRGLSNWSTYNSGAYRRYLAAGAPAFGSRGPRPSGGGGGGGIGGFFGGLGHDVASPFEAAWGGITDVAGFLKAALWLIDPLNWLRAAEFLVGTVVMLFGVYFMASATSSSSPAAKAVSALPLPGLGSIGKAAVKGQTRARAAQRAAGASSSSSSSSGEGRERRTEELHREKVRTQRARTAEIARRSRHRRRTAGEQAASERRAFIQGATEQAAHSETAKRSARRRAKRRRA